MLCEHPNGYKSIISKYVRYLSPGLNKLEARLVVGIYWDCLATICCWDINTCIKHTHTHTHTRTCTRTTHYILHIHIHIHTHTHTHTRDATIHDLHVSIYCPLSITIQRYITRYSTVCISWFGRFERWT